jgi:hypothetical protein
MSTTDWKSALRWVGAFAASALIATIGAALISSGLAFQWFVLVGFKGFWIGGSGGVVLGAALGLGLSLHIRKRMRLRQRVLGDAKAAMPWLLRPFPDGRRGVLCTWCLGTAWCQRLFPNDHVRSALFSICQSMNA